MADVSMYVVAPICLATVCASLVEVFPVEPGFRSDLRPASTVTSARVTPDQEERTLARLTLELRLKQRTTASN